jgi:hypothetical protein
MSGARTLATTAAVVVSLLSVGLLARWRPFTAAPEPGSVIAAPEPGAATLAVAAAAPPPSAATKPAMRYPIAEAAPVAASGQSKDLEDELSGLFGHDAVQSLLQLTEFPRRFVSTVDNLGRSHAPALMWPVTPAPDQFVVEAQGETTIVSADNGRRYTPYVLLLETVDLRQAVGLYVRLYPQLQRAYEELGYPGQHFNDRLVAVIDLLLATPDIDQPLRVTMPQVSGPIAPQRPWVMYEFDDLALQSLAPGQKLLLRMGPVNQRRVKQRLAEIRRLVAAPDALR